MNSLYSAIFKICSDNGWPQCRERSSNLFAMFAIELKNGPVASLRDSGSAKSAPRSYDVIFLFLVLKQRIVFSIYDPSEFDLRAAGR